MLHEMCSCLMFLEHIMHDGGVFELEQILSLGANRATVRDASTSQKRLQCMRNLNPLSMPIVSSFLKIRGMLTNSNKAHFLVCLTEFKLNLTFSLETKISPLYTM